MTTRVMAGMRDIFSTASPPYDLVFVQGDTTTTMATALASFYADIPVAHVEAGLRTGHMRSPFPEELNRIIVSRMADIHFCPTLRARDALLGEGIDESKILVTGNTGVDALLAAVRMLRVTHPDTKDATTIPDTQDADVTAFLTGPVTLNPTGHSAAITMDSSKRTVLVTCHRRESLLDPAALSNICHALETLARTRDDVHIVFPVHPNPVLRQAVQSRFSSMASIFLVEPLEYLSFVQLLERSYLVITDSGGIQEEAPCLGKPVLVIREVTERKEAVEAGTVIVVGTQADDIVKGAVQLLDDENAYEAMARAINPYGDGRAAPRIVDELIKRRLL